MRTFALVAAMGIVVVWSTSMAYANQPDARPLDPLGYALLAATALGLAWVWSRPRVSLVLCAAAAAACLVFGYAYAVWPMPALVALFVVIAAGHRTWGWAGAAVLVAVPAVGALIARDSGALAGLLVWVLMVVVVGQLGEVSRTRRERVADAERRMLAAERDREAEAVRRAQGERLKVARELHDVTSHTISLIALHAAVAAEAVDRAGGPAEAGAALRVIRTASREALAEMKAILGVLRADDAEGARGPLVEHPMPGSGQLHDLVEQAGLPVVLKVVGDERPLPPATELTLYRVVQEALTNTLRHAAATRATVTLRFETGAVVVQVDDDGQGARSRDPASCGLASYGSASHGSEGHGLKGMAERVAAVGGRLTVGDGSGRGFQVVAWLPIA